MKNSPVPQSKRYRIIAFAPDNQTGSWRRAAVPNLGGSTPHGEPSAGLVVDALRLSPYKSAALL
jgi:hypothetical protein